MTLLQIKLAVEAAGKNSISLAATELGIAQSNASQTIRKLEEELGFPIFRRNLTGITPTEEGYRFLENAEAILRADKAIHSISATEKTTRLRVGVINYTPATEAFIKFCKENRDVSAADLVCVNISAEDGARRLKERSLDIVVTVLPDEAIPAVEQLCRDYRLSCKRLRSIPVCVRMREDHPLLLSKALDGSREKFMQLSEYPYVDYNDLDHILPRNTSELPFGGSYIISVDERQTRLQTIAATNGYSIGCPILPNRLKLYGLTEVPVEGEVLELIMIIRRGDEGIPDIARYEELLLNEVSNVCQAEKTQDIKEQQE